MNLHTFSKVIVEYYWKNTGFLKMLVEYYLFNIIILFIILEVLMRAFRPL